MTVSIIICTRNRADSLRPTLASIGRAVVPAGWKVEVLVVDNGSTDYTPAVVAEAKLAHVIVRHIVEARAGQCYARNTGLAKSSGEAILFTDDDVRVPPTWISAMAQPILAGDSAALAGGVIFPRHVMEAIGRSPWSAKKSWFADTADLDRKAPSRLVGANMAFHRRVLQRVSGFDVELGPGALGFGDETLFSWQLKEAGFPLAGALDTAIEHHFDLSRLTGDNMLAAAQKHGRSEAFILHHWKHEKPPHAFRRATKCHLRRFWFRSLKQLGGNTSHIASNEALDLEWHVAFYREFSILRNRPRKYAQRGLTPLG